MKVAIVILCFSVCHAAVLVSPYRNPDEYGASVQFNNQDVGGNYNFGYNEGHLSGGSFRRESGDAFGNKIGSYGLRDADGRLRIVNYIADENGFRVKINTNEPGVEPQDPASASINKPALVPAPVIKAPVIRAPVAPFIRAAPVFPAPIAPVVQAPVYPAFEYIPDVPVRTVLPQRYFAALNVPAYANAVVPYAPYKGYPAPVPYAPYKGYPAPVPYAPYKGYPAPVPYAPYKGNPAPVYGGYYKSSPVVSKVQVPPPSVVGQIAIDPPRYVPQPYAFLNSKSLPTYQPLGFS